MPVISLGMCKAIENSSDEAKAKYLAGMAKSIPHKLELILPWLQGESVVDLGCADGKFAADLALNRGFQVVGLDMSPSIVKMAREAHKVVTNLHALEFKQAKAETFKLGKPVDNVVASSILHEVFSYGNGIEDVDKALRNIHANLNSGGRLIIRDFVKPYPNLIVDFWHKLDDITKGHSFKDFTKRYEPYKAKAAGYEIYSGVTLAEVYEYIFHKDFHDNWETEIQETYGFWDFEQAKAMLASAGFKIVHAAELDNAWILANRLEGKVKIQHHGTRVSIPKYQTLLVAEKA